MADWTEGRAKAVTRKNGSMQGARGLQSTSDRHAAVQWQTVPLIGQRWKSHSIIAVMLPCVKAALTHEGEAERAE